MLHGAKHHKAPNTEISETEQGGSQAAPDLLDGATQES